MVGVLSVVYSHCGAGTICSTDTIVCCTFGPLLTCHFINTNKLVVFDVPYPLLIVTYTTGMPQLRILVELFES